MSFRLTRVGMVGRSVDPSFVEMAPALTVIHGDSDTGKSLIFETIDFVLGAQALERDDIPDLRGYTHAILGVVLPDGVEVSLVRDLAGGAIQVGPAGLLGAPPAGETGKPLAWRHNAKRDDNLSSYLLKNIGLSSKWIRTNATGAVDSLSFRNLLGVCMVDETLMVGKPPAFLTGQWNNATKEKSVVKLLLTGEDDGAPPAKTRRLDPKALSRGKEEMLDLAISQLESELPETGDPAQWASQLARLSEQIEAELAQRQEAAFQIESAEVEQIALYDQLVASKRGHDELRQLISRFELLERQYKSDLERLEFVGQGGAYLGYFSPDPCAFCGARTEHQHITQHTIAESVSFAEAVATETAKTQALLAELQWTLDDLGGQEVTQRELIATTEEQHQTASARVREVRSRLRPSEAALAPLLEARSRVEGWLRVAKQIQDLNALRAGIPEPSPPPKSASPVLSEDAAGAFSSTIRSILMAWGVDQADSTEFDELAFDVRLGGQSRRSRGKGVRGVVKAATTVALAEFCLSRGLPHPGFIVLDSPLLTLRQPGKREIGPNDEALSATVAEACYTYLDKHFAGQAIVLENVDPPTLSEFSRDYWFSKEITSEGRRGFLLGRRSGD